MLDTVQSLAASEAGLPTHLLPFAAEASWVIGKWDVLQQFIKSDAASHSQDFNVEVGKALIALLDKDKMSFDQKMKDLRCSVARSLSSLTTASLSSAHSYTIKLHALHELDQIGGLNNPGENPDCLIECLDRRLDLLGAFTSDKQYLLGIRRAAMELST